MLKSTENAKAYSLEHIVTTFLEREGNFNYNVHFFGYYMLEIVGYFDEKFTIINGLQHYDSIGFEIDRMKRNDCINKIYCINKILDIDI